MLVHETFRESFITAGLYGVSITGATTPAAVNGAFYYGGVYNGKPYYIHTTGGYYLWWKSTATAQWRVSTTLGGAALFSRTNATLAGAYAAGTGTGTPMVTAADVWPGGFRGESEQHTIIPYGQVNDQASNRWLRYPLQIASYYPCRSTGDEFKVRRIVEQRAQAIADYYNALKGTTTAATGLTLTGWQIRTFQVSPLGVVDAPPISGGVLLKAVTNVIPVNVYPI